MPPLPVPYKRAEQVAERLSEMFPELTFAPTQFGSKGFWITVAKAGDGNGLLMATDQLDNGASGIKDEGLRRILAFAENREYVEPARAVGKLTYDDVMTTTSGS